MTGSRATGIPVWPERKLSRPDIGDHRSFCARLPIGGAAVTGRRRKASKGDAGDRLSRQRIASPFAPLVAAFYRGLSETRDVLGQNLATEYRWAEGLRHGEMFLTYLAVRGSDQD